MKSWENMWDLIVSDSRIKEEYRQAFLLNLFQKMCSKMNRDEDYRTRILNLLRQSSDPISMTKTIVSKEFYYSLSSDDAVKMFEWLDAYRKKQSHRAPISLAEKERLFDRQKGLCAVCGQPLGTDWEKIHVDHIIPFVLVGDELKDNYQDLCETCNKCKSSKTDYIFLNLLNLG